MRHTVTTLVDDLDGSEDDVTTTTFGLDGKAYEIDLSDDHQNDLHEALAVYIEHARPVKGGQKPGPKPPGNGRVDRSQTQAMRAWLRQHGYPVKDRGRIPAELKALYHAGA